MGRHYSLEDVILDRPLIRSGNKKGFLAAVIADNYQISVDHPPILFLDPNGGNKDVRLPAVASSTGLEFFIVNTEDATANLVVKTTDEVSTILTLAELGGALFYCDGVVWRGYALSTAIAASIASLAVSGNATVGGTFGVTGVATLPLVTNTPLALTAVASGSLGAAASAGGIPTGTRAVALTCDTATKCIQLPTPVVGHEVIIATPGTTGFELRSSAPATIAINGGMATAGESAVPGTALLVRAVAVSATAWVVNMWDADGDEAKVEAAAA